MSLSWKPGRFPQNYDPVELERVFYKMLESMGEPGFKYLLLQEQNAEPERLLPYMMVMADGANWNPGSGRGLYRRNGANTAWIYIG